MSDYEGYNPKRAFNPVYWLKRNQLPPSDEINPIPESLEDLISGITYPTKFFSLDSAVRYLQQETEFIPTENKILQQDKTRNLILSTIKWTSYNNYNEEE